MLGRWLNYYWMNNLGTLTRVPILALKGRAHAIVGHSVIESAPGQSRLEWSFRLPESTIATQDEFQRDHLSDAG